MVSPGLRLERDLFVLARVQQAERHAFHANLQDLAAAADHRRERAGVGHHDLARGGFHSITQQRDVPRFHFALDQGVVQRLHQLGGTAAARRQRPQQAAHQAAVQRRRGAFAADVAERDHGLTRRCCSKTS